MIDEEALRSIEKLHQMKQDGIISEADFEKAKQDILQGKPRPRAAAPNVFMPQNHEHPEMPAEGDQPAWFVFALRRYAVFSGRSGRREFWMFQVVVVMLSIIFWTSFTGLFAGTATLPIFAVACLALIALTIPQLALQVRRFHDQNKSGWFALLNLVPYFGPFIVLLFMLIGGTHGENQYGPDPYNR